LNALSGCYNQAKDTILKAHNNAAPGVPGTDPAVIIKPKIQF